MNIKSVTFGCLLLSTILNTKAQVISDFTTLGGTESGGEWVTAVSLSGGVATIGSPAIGDGSFSFADITGDSLSLNTSLILSYTARVDVGNLNNSFTVRFADSEGIYSLQAIVVTTGWVAGEWVSGTVNLVADPEGGSLSDITYFTLLGDGSTNDFRMSFDNLAAVPEPAAYAALFGTAAIGFCVWRKRRAA